MSTSEANILGRIKKALGTKAPRPWEHGASGTTNGTHATGTVGTHGTSGPGEAPPGHHSPREWLPLVGEQLDERLGLFARNSEALATEFDIFRESASLSARLSELASSERWTGVASHRNKINKYFCGTLPLPTLWVDDGYSTDDLERCDVAITSCDALVAQTGSVVVSSRSAGGRALSVLPPHHIVIATPDQVVADLPDAFALLESRYSGNYPSFLSFITGPSRTGDIERILVLGAHGPKRLSVYIIEEF